MNKSSNSVIPAKAGIQKEHVTPQPPHWIPAFAGMTRDVNPRRRTPAGRTRRTCSIWKPGTTWFRVSTGRKCSKSVTTKKPWPRYASTRRRDVRSPVIHSSASSNTRWVADSAPCPSVGPRKRNPRREKGVNRWLSPIWPPYLASIALFSFSGFPFSTHLFNSAFHVLEFPAASFTS